VGTGSERLSDFEKRNVGLEYSKWTDTTAFLDVYSSTLDIPLAFAEPDRRKQSFNMKQSK